MLICHNTRRGNNRRGTVMIYVLVSFTVMMGFCALAVDLGRAQAAKTELRRAADAAARTAMLSYNSGNSISTATNDAIAIAGKNMVDGSSLTLNGKKDVFFGNWNLAKRVFTAGGTPTNAVQVFARRTSSTANPIPMMFAQALGKSTLDVWASSTVALVTVQSINESISAHSNPWLAGQDTVGTTASLPDRNLGKYPHLWSYDIADPNSTGMTRTTNPFSSPPGEPNDSPVQVNLTLSAGDIITVTNVGGTAQNDPTGASYTAVGGNNLYYADEAASTDHTETGTGNASGTGSEHGIANTKTPLNSMLGVFLTDDKPDNTPAPKPMLFDSTTLTDYKTVSPLSKQVIYVGDGQTSTGSQQQIIVPADATRFFLGTQDGHEWSNNVNGYSATITQSRIELVQ